MLIINLLSYSSLMNIAVFRPTTTPFYINNYRYRESINPIFALGFKEPSIHITESPIATYLGYIYYGKRQLHNTVFSDNIWKPIDTIHMSTTPNELIYVLASTSGLQHSINYKITVDGAIITEQYMKNMNYFNNIIISKGKHVITLWGKSSTPTCLCPSLKNGYSMSYQFAIWKIKSDTKDVYHTYSKTSELLTYENNINLLPEYRYLTSIVLGSLLITGHN